MTHRVIMRCNASARVGLGHLMRCREMARDLQTRGWDSVILGPPEVLRTPEDADLFTAWHPVDQRGDDAKDAARVTALCQTHGTDLAVMDDYRISPAYQTRLRQAGLRWMQQFDASTPCDYWCDVLVNASPYETRAQYLPWLQREAAQQTLFGPEYAVLRPAFRSITVQPDARPVRRLLVAFGGGDDRGAVDLSLTALAGQLDDTALEVVCGPANPNLAAIRARVDALPAGTATLHVAPPDMAGLMAGCDMALIAGGTMSYEAAICGLPMLFIGLAPNQARPCRGWTDRVGAPYLGDVDQVTPDTIRSAVQDMIADAPGRAAMAAKSRALVDGQGAARLVDALLGIGQQ